MIFHDKLWGHAEFQKNSRFSLEGAQNVRILCSKSKTGRYTEHQIRASHQEEERSKFLYIHFIHLKEIFHTDGSCLVIYIYSPYLLPIMK